MCNPVFIVVTSARHCARRYGTQPYSICWYSRVRRDHLRPHSILVVTEGDLSHIDVMSHAVSVQYILLSQQERRAPVL